LVWSGRKATAQEDEASMKFKFTDVDPSTEYDARLAAKGTIWPQFQNDHLGNFSSRNHLKSTPTGRCLQARRSFEGLSLEDKTARRRPRAVCPYTHFMWD